MFSDSFHIKTLETVEKELDTSLTLGISKKESEKRLETFGFNELPKPKKKSKILLFLGQFKSTLVVLLIGATLVSLTFGETLDAIAILAILVINAFLGFIQENKAEEAIEALKKLSTLHSKVVRDGETVKIESRLLVPGDLILLEAGDKIPADARIIELAGFEVSEAVLTGESQPVKKTIEPIANPSLPIADRINIAFKDTSVAHGRAKAIVYATGKDTEVGKISSMLSTEKDPPTPLQTELERVGKGLSLGALLIILVIFVFQFTLNQGTVRIAFLTAVSLAVAAIPEGLPAVITLVLALGVARLAKAKAIIRRLPAIETLGATTHILTDKTGTLTQNRMVVTKVITSSKEEFDVSGEGYTPKGSFINGASQEEIQPSKNTDLLWVLRLSVLCNDAVLNENKESKNWDIVGDITEGALIVAGVKAGLDIKKEKEENKRVFEIPFSSASKFMVTINETKDSSDMLVCMKGAPEVLLEKSSIAVEDKEFFQKAIDRFSRESLRSIGIAYKKISKIEFEGLLLKEDKSPLYHNMIFSGIMSQEDPIREEVKEALRLANKAGITTVMVTGDHKLTATSIAKKLGIILDDSEAISGEELLDISPEKLTEVLKSKKVFARVSPEEKLMLVKAFKKMGNVVAVTGDGVNDAPAIKSADIGISMGIEGTDVAKEASDMILEDDNYSTIVSAIREGRTIFDNLMKFITYLISCNISEVFVVFAASILRLPIPLLPIHLLWINLVTDGLPALGLGMEAGEENIMERKPRDIKARMLSKSNWAVMLIHGTTMGLASLAIFNYSLVHFDLATARTLVFLTLSISQLIYALSARSQTQSIFKTDILGNTFLFWVFIGSVMIQIPIIYTKVGSRIFDTVPVSLSQLSLATIAALAPIIISETTKAFKNSRSP